MNHSGAPKKQANSAVSRKSDGKAMAAGGLSVLSFRFQIPSFPDPVHDILREAIGPRFR